MSFITKLRRAFIKVRPIAGENCTVDYSDAGARISFHPDMPSLPEYRGRISPVIAKLDGVALTGGYNAKQQYFTGTAFAEMVGGIGWGDDYNPATDLYDDREALSLRDVNGGSAGVSWAIVAVTVGTKTVAVAGNHAEAIEAAGTVQILTSTGNEGIYTVSTATYDTGRAETDVVLVEALADATVDGDLHIFDGVYVIAFPVAGSNGNNQWYFDGVTSALALQAAIEAALFTLPHYDPAVIQLLGHDTTPELRWYTGGSFTCT